MPQRAAGLNGVGERVRTERADAFAYLEAAEPQSFGLVIADPPAFVRSRKDLGAGLRGYRKLARLAARLVAPGGFLLAASCSHNVAPEAFALEVARGLAQAGRTGRVLRMAGAAPDHPVHPMLPESAYLKAMVLQLDWCCSAGWRPLPDRCRLAVLDIWQCSAHGAYGLRQADWMSSDDWKWRQCECPAAGGPAAG